MVTIESISASLRLAADWRAKGQPTWVAKCQSSALTGLLSISVTQCADATTGTAWLRDHSIVAHLIEHFENLKAIATEVEQKRLPGSVIAGNYHLLVFAHMAWCLREFDLGESFVSFSLRNHVHDLSTPFWREYSRGIGTLVKGGAYRLEEIRLRGQEKYWVGYLRFVEAVTAGKNYETEAVKARELFVTRNADKNIRDDSYQIEGSASQPARWDFRLFGLLKYVEERWKPDGEKGTTN